MNRWCTPRRQLHPGYEPDSQTRQAIEYLRGRRGESKPFALFLSWGPPHDPWDQQNQPPPPIDPVKNKVTIDPAGTIFWNGTPINQVVLRQYLDLTQQMNPIPELHLEPDPQARYVVVDEVLAVTKRAHVEKMGFIGNERYAAF